MMRQVPHFHVTEAAIRRGLDDGIRELIKGLAMLPRSPFHNV
jgi:hypothetical protein